MADYAPEDLARVSDALLTPLSEAKAHVDAGHIGSDLADLLRHAHDLLNILSVAIAEFGDDAQLRELRAAAGAYDARLTMLEREVAGRPLH
jgi:hypothetical protein